MTKCSPRSWPEQCASFHRTSGVPRRTLNQKGTNPGNYRGSGPDPLCHHHGKIPRRFPFLARAPADPHSTARSTTQPGIAHRPRVSAVGSHRCAVSDTRWRSGQPLPRTPLTAEQNGSTVQHSQEPNRFSIARFPSTNSLKNSNRSCNRRVATSCRRDREANRRCW